MDILSKKQMSEEDIKLNYIRLRFNLVGQVILPWRPRLLTEELI